MYTQLGLTEKIAIVDKILRIESMRQNSSKILVPDNMAEIFIPLGSDITIKCMGSVRSLLLKEGKGYFCMPRRRGAMLSMEQNSDLLIVKINPIYANKIAKELKELSNGIFAIDLGQGHKRDLMSAWEGENTYAASDVVEDILDTSIDFYNYNETILNSVDQIRASCGKTSVKDIYLALNVSKSKLEQHFNREVGLTPKEFCKIEKINCFINSYLEDPSQSLTELTYLCGYYDQSHLIKDFKYFLNTSPKKFFASV
ncbi:helix-turn-helix domain-containing protein [Ekhidna sp. To15]|uniref:helix-turn-helix domain-containing protein n=1 Tax=Ekhidna sp. To15 TaxID=3395267 RepID=UPI003F522BAD